MSNSPYNHCIDKVVRSFNLQAELEADIFSLYDVDNSGHIEFTEFLLIVSVMSDGTAKTKLQQIFRSEIRNKNKFYTCQLN